MDSNPNSEYEIEAEDGIIEENIDNPPNNNLIWAVICTVFCCPPVGFYAIFKSIKINTLWNKGEFEEARKINYEVKKWSIVGILSGIILISCYILSMLIAGTVSDIFKKLTDFF